MKKTTIAAAVLVAVAAAGYPIYRSMFGVEAVEVNATAQQQKIAEYANPQAFITPEGLQQLQQENKDVVVIGSLNPMRGDSPIKDSFTIWRPDYSAKEGEYAYGGMRAEHDDLEALLGSFGATADSTIVVYSANSHHDATRLYWQIEMLGHEDVRFLDGGLNAWAGAGLPTGDANPEVAPAEYKSAGYNEAKLATFEMVANAIDSDEWVIIDTRSASENDGSNAVSGAFGPGTITSSNYIEWTNANNADTTLKSVEELKAIYGDVIEGKKVISFCQSGVRSAHTTFVLEEALGATEVYNYDGSWIQWSHAHYEENKEGADVSILSES